MNAGNLAWTLGAIVIAMGSAFTAQKKTITKSAHIWIKKTNTSPYSCTAVPLTCQQVQVGQLCTVIVTLANEIEKTINIFNDNGCSITLRNAASPYPLHYDAGVGDRPFDATNTPDGNSFETAPSL